MNVRRDCFATGASDSHIGIHTRIRIRIQSVCVCVCVCVSHSPQFCEDVQMWPITHQRHSNIRPRLRLGVASCRLEALGDVRRLCLGPPASFSLVALNIRAQHWLSSKRSTGAVCEAADCAQSFSFCGIKYRAGERPIVVAVRERVPKLEHKLNGGLTEW